MPLTPRQLQANRDNAQLSTGPRTPEGKATSSLNALRTGLTSRNIIFASDTDAVCYQLLLADYTLEFNPQGQREEALVQRLADTEWRLRRIPALEQALYTGGHYTFAHLFPEVDDPNFHAQLLDQHIFLTYQRQFNNLSIQESRLRRYYTKDQAELKTLQTERKAKAEPTAPQPAQPKPPQPTKTATAAATSMTDGFVFSTAVTTHETHLAPAISLTPEAAQDTYASQQAS